MARVTADILMETVQRFPYVTVIKISQYNIWGIRGDRLKCLYHSGDGVRRSFRVGFRMNCGFSNSDDVKMMKKLPLTPT